MTGPWLASYIALWILVLAAWGTLGLILWRLGSYLTRPSHATTDAVSSLPESAKVPRIEHDGPAIGSFMPTKVLRTVDGTDLRLPRDGTTLLVFLSATCANCEDSVQSLNALAKEPAYGVQPIAILRAAEETCRAFVDMIRVEVPTVCDDRQLTMEFGVHRNPFGLLYDASGTLIRKGIVEDWRDLLSVVVGATSTSEPPDAGLPTHSSTGSGTQNLGRA